MSPPPPARPSAVDYFQMVTSGLFLLLGATIIFRSLLGEGAPPLAHLVGASFIAFGLYRLKFVARWCRSRREPHES